ncbi:hypothetical protein BO78DRAFT_391298 [Aspergillus sclerotiicarbonarius CBS 121057]|uniref:Xylanolytic transcriptional activator regulatory domain-containing protein n=1 Tax=Aspergillus sclerotiicarbonarius (strain CBS 121057 / IBT 28362) TaxID=1448318 RepID=A0A319DU10_ASPSB|nr:hypothetical protein BO78DRAFT_391298 [Aspergillus sclerotiicarbonarius CBS 121057]
MSPEKDEMRCCPPRRSKVLFPVCTGCQKSAEKDRCLYATGRNGRRMSVDPTADESAGKEPNPTAGLDTRLYSDVADGGNIHHGIASTVTSSVEMPVSKPPSVDSMNGMTGDPTQFPEVFGSSSAGSFMRRIQAATRVDQGSGHVPARRSLTGITDHSLKDNSLPGEKAALTALPPRGLADCLVQAYWKFEWSVYPIVDRRHVEVAYESLWSSPRPDCSVVLMSTINLCFALGCHYCELLPPEECKSLSEDFFTRAEYYLRQSQYIPSLEKVQCLLLSTIYLQSTDHVLRCWMTAGEAIRMAQSLGLHLDQDTSFDTVRVRENIRRTWHGCVWLDRVLSATLGRPGMIPKWLFTSVPLPSMIDDEFFDTQADGSDTRPDGKPCILAFSVKAFELYLILDDILVEIYLNSNHDIDVNSKLTSTLEIDSKIQAWKGSLPNHLQYTPSARNDGSIVHRQATILRIRSLHIRILLFRPALIGYCKRGVPEYTERPPDSADSSLSDIMLFQCSRKCSNLHMNWSRSSTVNSTLRVPKRVRFHPGDVFTAATIILVERFLENKKENPSKNATADRIWDAAIHVLQTYTVVADSATKCLAALDVLSESLYLGSSEARLRQSFLEMSRLLGDVTSIPPFDIDDFLWLG